jgi:hypothetical protein
MEGVISIIDLIMGEEVVAEVAHHEVVVLLATSGSAPECHQPLVQLQSEFFLQLCMCRSLIFMATVEVHEYCGGFQFMCGYQQKQVIN